MRIFLILYKDSAVPTPTVRSMDLFCMITHAPPVGEAASPSWYHGEGNGCTGPRTEGRPYLSREHAVGIRFVPTIMDIGGQTVKTYLLFPSG